MPKRKKRLFIRTILYIVVASHLFLIVLGIIFYTPWFRSEAIIVPVVKNAKTEELEVSKLLSENGIEFVSVDMVSDYVDIKLKDGGSVYISFRKDIRVQISSLQKVLKQLTINGKRFDLIDFRFEKPVVRYTTRSTNKNTKQHENY